MVTNNVDNDNRIRNFFKELETRNSLLTNFTQLHKAITDHFTSLDQYISSKSQTLDSQVEALESQTKKTLESLENRENTIPERESNAAARIEEQKNAAIADIEKGETENGDGGRRSISDVLRMCCRRMDSTGLIRFLLAKRKESGVLRVVIEAAVEEDCVDAMSFVLGALEEFVDTKVEGKVGMADRRWAVAMLIQAVVPVVDGAAVATSVRDRAARVMEKWKGVMSVRGGGGDGAGAGAGEALMFLQAVVGFGLKEKIEEDYLRKLILEYATKRDMGKVALALRFGDKIKGIIDELVKTGKEIEAVYFAYEFGLTDQFPPLPLLRTFHSNSKKNAHNISKKGKYSMSAVEEANNSELNATKAIIRCVEENKLESQFPLESLRRRMTQLEKIKSEKKGGPSVGKPTNKRARRGGRRGVGLDSGGQPPSHRRPKVGRLSNASPSFRHHNPSQSHQATALYKYPPSHGVYESPASASYGPGYVAGRTQSPSVAALPQQYPYAGPQGVGVTVARAGGSYGGGQAGYGSAYDYSAASGPAYPNYPQ